MHATPKYTTQQERPIYLVPLPLTTWICQIRHTDDTAEWRNIRHAPIALRDRLYHMYLKCVTKPTSEWKLFNSAPINITTSKGDNRSISAGSTRLHWPPTVLDNSCRHNGCRSILQIISELPWTLSRHLDEISHRNAWPRRNTKHDIFGARVLSTQQRATPRRNCRLRPTNMSLHTRQETRRR